jgi:SET domain-containing protein
MKCDDGTMSLQKDSNEQLCWTFRCSCRFDDDKFNLPWGELQNYAHRCYISPSMIGNAGLGLFASRSYFVGDVIVQYDGEHLTKQDHELLYPGRTLAPYSIRLDETTYIDGSDPLKSTLARYANDSQNESLNNAKIVTFPDNKTYLEAIKPIQAKQEIFVDYGKEYWSHLTVDDAFTNYYSLPLDDNLWTLPLTTQMHEFQTLSAY